jgi:transposase-like protein
MEAKYYVYVYSDPRKKGEFVYGENKFKYEPFYVGKGVNNRYLKHLTETEKDTENLFKFRVIEKIKSENLIPIITKVVINVEESEAYKIESELINLIGRRCDGTGCLTNIVIDANPPSNYKPLSKDTIEKIIELYNNGYYLKHIGAELSLNENKVKRTLIENGISPKRKSPLNKIKITDEIIKKICDEYENGSSIRTIGQKYSLSYEFTRKTIKNSGLNLRGYDYHKSDEHIKKIHENRVYKTGEENNCYKTLSNEEITKLKDLRFNQHKSIRSIIKEMKISQKKYYEYINL